MKSGILKQVCATAVLMTAVRAFTEDWPQWRCDAHRSAATSEQLPAGMKQQWKLALGKPAPAYDHQFRMCADYTYAPVSAEGLLFVPSNVSDQVMAFDLETGALKWRYVTEGPVRFSPVYDDGKVYFASDDGYLYCVSAQKGSLLWKTRGVPDANPDALMLVNGRMVSRWPSRGAPILHDGLIYFGTGVWPEEGVYQNAVQAQTGELVWQNDALSYLEDGMSDHWLNYDLSLPPQGYPAVINGKLAVTSGRTLAAWFDLKNGKLDPYTCFYVKAYVPRGTWYVAGNDDFWVQGGNWFGSNEHAAPPKPDELMKLKTPLEYTPREPEIADYVMKHRPFLCSDKPLYIDDGGGGEFIYSDPVITDTTSYGAVYEDKEEYQFTRGHTFVDSRSFDKIEARDLTKPKWIKTPRGSRKKPKGDVAVIEFPLKWELKTSMRVLVKAGNHLVAGEEGRIALIKLPSKGSQPQIAWEAKVEGDPLNTLVADGKIVTVTDTGNVYCFGAGKTSKPTIPVAEKVAHSPANGFACVLGWGDGAAVKKMAHDPEWRVVVLEKDPAVIAKARQELNSQGLNGRRVQIIEARQDLELTPYWASKVVVNDSSLLGGAEKTWSVAVDCMRPYSGKLAVTDRERVQQAIAEKSGFRLDGNVLSRVAPPEGSADWSHETAGADNSFVSHDQLVKWPLGVLWYSGDIDRFYTPEAPYQHERNPYPLVQGGRMFIITFDRLHAIDIYTGNYLWETQMPVTPYQNTRKMSTRLYGRPTERNYVLTEDIIYCITGDEIVMYDVTTGKSVGKICVPEKLQAEAKQFAGEIKAVTEKHSGEKIDLQAVPEWTEVRISGDLLIGNVGKHLIAVDRTTGKMKWSRKTTQEVVTCTLADGMVYGIDCVPDSYTSKTKQHEKTGLLFALDMETGREQWRKEFSYKSFPNVKVMLNRLWIRQPMPLIGHNGKHNLLVVSYRGLRTMVFKATDGSMLWAQDEQKIKDPANVHSPNILDDHIMISLHGNGGMGYLVDILTGKKLQYELQVPRARTCGRLVGNAHLLTYRDAATRMYDIERNLTIPFNSMRAGCTTSFIPANGVMSAPMLGHGCVCNYPMFASMAMVHMPESDSWRPAEVKASWGADQRAQAEKAKRKSGGKKK